MFCLTVLLVGAISGAQGQGQQQACPHDFGFYPHEIRCDQYWACEEGIPILKTCGNGLAFADTDPDYLTEDCDYFRNVDCSTRPERAPPIPTLHCDYQHGVFADKSDCAKFWSCWGGEESSYDCSNGLAYNSKSGICDWRDKVPACAGDQLADQVSQDFQCPAAGELVALRTFTRHAHTQDCRQYYVCLDGVLREYGCPVGTVYQLGAQDGYGECADPRDVPGCEDYYGDLDLSNFKQELPLVARGGQAQAAAAPQPVQGISAPLRPLRNRPGQQRVEELVIDAAALIN